MFHSFRPLLVPVLASAVCLFGLLSTFSPHAIRAENRPQTTPPGEIKFVGSNRLVTAPGAFNRWTTTKAELSRPDSTTIDLDIRVEVDVASIDTGNSQRDNHLRSADFFDVSRYPKANLRLYDAHPKGAAQGNVQTCTGKLDFAMHGRKQTYNVTFDLVGGDRPYVRGKLNIDRNDFGVGEPYRRFALLSVYDSVSIAYSCLVHETTTSDAAE